MVLRREDPLARVTVPDHKVIRVGTLRHILNEAGLNVDEFIRLLKGKSECREAVRRLAAAENQADGSNLLQTQCERSE